MKGEEGSEESEGRGWHSLSYVCPCEEGEVSNEWECVCVCVCRVGVNGEECKVRNERDPVKRKKR